MKKSNGHRQRNKYESRVERVKILSKVNEERRKIINGILKELNRPIIALELNLCSM